MGLLMFTDQDSQTNPQISYFPFTSSNSKKRSATVLSWSDSGLCFKASMPLYRGQYICVHVTQMNDDADDLPFSSVAQVQECDENQDLHHDIFIIEASYL